MGESGHFHLGLTRFKFRDDPVFPTPVGVEAATTLAMAFKLMETAQKKWFRLRGYKLLAGVVGGVKFVNGVKQNGD